MSSGLLLNHVAVGYRNRKVLADLSLPCILSGSVVGILGPNAVGKSTLLKVIAGIRPCAGEIRLDGNDLIRMSAAERIKRVGYLPQALPQTSSLIAYETVLSACRAVRPDLPVRQIEAAIDETFDALNLRELAMRRLSEMSGGQRQMVGLAQVLVRKPRLLLLDEPTSALDLHWQLNVLDVVRHSAERDGSICLMAMHDINLALRLCDRVVVLNAGRAIADGRPADVMTKDVLRAAYSVEGRVERCSQGMPIVLIDRALERRIAR